jgi:ribosomal protein S6E (S10)
MQTMNAKTVAAMALLLLGCGESPAQALGGPAFEMGAWVSCNGAVGTVENIEAGAQGGAATSYVVQVWAGANSYQVQCSGDQLRAAAEPGTAAAPPLPAPVQVPTPPPAPRPAPAPQVAAAPAPQATDGVACVPGAKLQAAYFGEWYNVTVIGGVDARGGCMVDFDDKPESWNTSLSEFRPRPQPAAECVPGAKVQAAYYGNWYNVTVVGGTDPQGRCMVSFDDLGEEFITGLSGFRPRPAQTPGRQNAGGVPDGAYSCGKITPLGDGFQNFGTFNIRGGRVIGNPFPAGWTVQSIERNPDPSRLLVHIRYTSARGTADMLDCEME